MKFLEGFWDSYLKVGRCAIDPSHSEHFMASRFREHESGRECLWCGHQQRKVVTQTKKPPGGRHFGVAIFQELA